MGTLMGRMHAFPGTTFSSVAARGAYEAEANAVLTFREFERILALEVLGPYHNEVHTTLERPPGGSMGGGFGRIEQRHPPEPDRLLRDFLPFEERLARRGGSGCPGIQYQDGALAHLVGTTDKLRVKYDHEI